MGNCNITTMVVNEGPEKLKAFMSELGNGFAKKVGFESGEKEKYYKELFTGFGEAMFQMKGADYVKESLNADDIPNNMNEFVKENIFYDSLEDVFKEPNQATRMAALQQLHRATEFYTSALTANNFKKDNHAFQQMQGTYISALKNIDKMQKRGEGAAAVLSGGMVNQTGGVLLGNFAKAWEKHPVVYKLEYDQGNLYQYARNYFTHAKDAFTQIFTRNLEGDTKLSFKMAQTLLKYMDKQYESLDFDKRLSAYGITDNADIDDIKARMNRINEEWQVLNYGDTLENIAAMEKGEDRIHRERYIKHDPTVHEGVTLKLKGAKSDPNSYGVNFLSEKDARKRVGTTETIFINMDTGRNTAEGAIKNKKHLGGNLYEGSDGKSFIKQEVTWQYKEAKPSGDPVVEKFTTFNSSEAIKETLIATPRAKKYDPADPMYSYEHNAIQYEEDGKPKKLDSYLYAITKMGKLLADMANNKHRTSEIHQSERKVLDWFGENKSFQPRMNNYVPSESDDMVSKMFGGGEFAGLFRDVDFLQHLKKGVAPAEDSLAINSFVRNNQVFQHMLEKVSSFSTQRAKLDALKYNNNEFAKTSPQAYKIIKHETERRIASFDKKWEAKDSDPMTALTKSTKKLAGSYNSFIGTTILNLSAPVNYVAGLTSAGTRLGIAGLKDHTKYLKTLKDSGWQGDTARRIRDFMEHESPIGSKTDELVRPEINFKDGNSWFTNGLNLLSHTLDKVSTFNVEKGFFGMIPGFKWLAFNNSENFLTRINESLLHKEVDGYLQGAIKSGELDPSDPVALRTMTDDAIKKFETTSYMKSKQAIGYFDAKTKPFWTHERFSNAESMAGVLGGAFLQQLYMFKHVEWLNTDLLNRSIAALPVTDLKQLKANIAVGGAAASPAFASAIMAMTTYDMLTDETVNDMMGWDMKKPIRSSLLSAITPTALTKDIGVTAASMFYHTVMAPMFNLPVSEKALDQIEGFGKGLMGVWFSRNGRYQEMVDDAYQLKLSDIAMELTPDKDVYSWLGNIGDVSKNTYEFNKEAKATMRENAKVPVFGFPLSSGNDWLKLLADGGTAVHGITRAFKTGKAKDAKDAGKFISKTIGNMLFGSVWYPRTEQDKFEWDNRNFDYSLSYNRRNDYYKGSKEWTAFDSFLNSMKRGKFYGFAYHNQQKMLRSNTAFYKDPPVTVYRGENLEYGFYSDKARKLGSDPDFKRGSLVTDNPEVAKAYAQMRSPKKYLEEGERRPGFVTKATVPASSLEKFKSYEKGKDGANKTSTEYFLKDDDVKFERTEVIGASEIPAIIKELGNKTRNRSIPLDRYNNQIEWLLKNFSKDELI